MDSFDSPRSSVPARLPTTRPGSLALRAGTGLAEAAAPTTLSVRVALRGARRYWWLILLLWVVGSAGIGAVVYVKVRPTYRAFSYLRVDPTAQDLYGVRTNGEALDAFLQTQVQLMTSPNVLTTASTNPKATVLPRIQAAGDVVLELRKSIMVTVVPGTYLIEVSMTSQSAYEAATLVNAVVDAFIEANLEWSDGMTRTQIKNLEQYLGDLKNSSDEVERRWREVAARGDTDTPILEKQANGKVEARGTSRSSVTIEEYKQVRRDLLKVGLDLAETRAWAESARKAAAEAGNDPDPGLDRARLDREIDRKVRADPETKALALKMKAAQDKVNEVIRVSNLPGDPAEMRAKKQLNALTVEWQQHWDAKRLSYREQIEAAGGSGAVPDREIREAEAKVRALEIRQATLKEQYENLDVKNRHAATDEVDVAVIHDERDSLRGMREAVVRRLEQLKFEAKGEARIRPVNAAVPPGRPISDNRMKILAMTPVGVLGTVLGLIVLLEIRSARVADPDVLSSRVKHEVFSIAPLPNIRPGEDATSDRAEQRLARFVQSLDHLRVALCEGGMPGQGRCVMITSATGGEGKTTLSAHLAARCANAGTSTLLIDADMRRASLGRLLDVPVGPGLGDVLAGEVELDDALITVQAGGFHFLSAGTAGRDPSRVLKSTRLSSLIGRLRETYDLVIIDTPPVLPVADALILGRYADGAVMAARFDASRLPLVERANRQLQLAGIPVLGVVVNGVRGQNSTYGNYAYSYNYPGRSENPAGAPSA